MKTHYGWRPGLATDSCPHCGEPRTDGALCGDCANEIRSEAAIRADRREWEHDRYEDERREDAEVQS